MAQLPSPRDLIDAAPGGARFFRADLHIHSFGGSHDVSDATMTPDRIVATAVAEGLDLIAVTDHNEISNVGPALAAASGSPLLVIPGVELTTSHGHLLVYFRSLDDLDTFMGRLTIVDRGTATSRCQTALLECLNQIDPSRGMAVLAHIDGGGGLDTLITGSPPHKVDILIHRALLGFELKHANSPILYSDADQDATRAHTAAQRRVALGLGTTQSLARVLFSDSHSLAALGRNANGDKRVTRVKMDSPSYDGLRLALLDADARVRLEDLVPPTIPRILGIILDGGFLDNQTIRFSSNLTCIIGGRGAGKTTLFETLRAVSTTQGTSGHVDSDIWPEQIHVVAADQAGQVFTLRRRKGEEPENLDDPLALNAVPAECYGQGDTTTTSQQATADPMVLLAYLDRFVDLDALRKQQEEIRQSLLENQTAIEAATLEVAKIPEFQRLLATVSQQLNVLEQAKAKDIVSLERQVADERAIRTRIESLATQIRDGLGQDQALANLRALRTLAVPDKLAVGGVPYKEIISLTHVLEAKTSAAAKDLVTEGKTYLAGVGAQLSTWTLTDRATVANIEKKRTELQAQGIRLDLAYIRKLANDEASHKKTLASLAEIKVRLLALQRERIGLLARHRDIRAKISAARDAFARGASQILASSLSDIRVSLKFVSNALSPEVEDVIREAMAWRTVQVPRASIIARSVTLPVLLDAIRRNDPSPLTALKDRDGARVFTPADARDILARLKAPHYLFRLERCLVEDLPRLIVTKLVQRGGSTVPMPRDFARLSLGQQQSVLLSLMLCSTSTAPLLIDQPEDNLDGEFVYHSLVPALRMAKERRQIIVVTHNANIAVLGDAELIVTLKSLSDRATIVARGSIDDPGTRSAACEVLEGAREAFRRRATVYGVL